MVYTSPTPRTSNCIVQVTTSHNTVQILSAWRHWSGQLCTLVTPLWLRHTTSPRVHTGPGQVQLGSTPVPDSMTWVHTGPRHYNGKVHNLNYYFAILHTTSIHTQMAIHVITISPFYILRVYILKWLYTLFTYSNNVHTFIQIAILAIYVMFYIHVHT